MIEMSRQSGISGLSVYIDIFARATKEPLARSKNGKVRAKPCKDKQRRFRDIFCKIAWTFVVYLKKGGRLYAFF